MTTPLKYAAKMHTVEVAWRLCNSYPIVIGPEPRLVLGLRALRDVEMLNLKVDFPELETQEGEAESLLAEVPRVWGLRRLKPEGEPYVLGTEDVDAAAMLSAFAAADERVSELNEYRWHGGLVQIIEHNRNAHPCVYWAWRGRVIVPKEKCLGLIVRATAPTICRVKLSGV